MERDKLIAKYLKLHKDEFEAFVDEERIKSIKRDFDVLNKHFEEINIGLKCMNDHEKLYRDKHTNCWMSHSELRYKPFFKLEEEVYSIRVFTKILAEHFDYDFCLECDYGEETTKYKCRSVNNYIPYANDFSNYSVIDNQVVEVCQNDKED